MIIDGLTNADGTLVDGIVEFADLDAAAQSITTPRVVRQTVLAGSTDSSGYADFLSAGTGLNVDLAATTTAVRLAFAAGFSSNGADDYIENITADQTSYFGTLAANAENYLYVDRNVTTGALTGGATTNLPPVYGKTYTDAEGVGKSYLNFDGTDGSTTMTDANPNNSWTAYGNAQLDTAQSKFGGSSLLLDGSGDYIESTSFAMHAGANEGGFSVELWFRPSVTGINQTIIHNNPTGYGFSISLNSANKLVFYATSVAGSWNIANNLSGTATVSSSTWYHLKFMWDGSTYKIYLNGTEDISATSSLAFLESKKLALGFDGVSGYFNGWIDDFSYEVGPQTLGAFTAPTAARDGLAVDNEHWFDTTEMKMKVWNQSTTSWDEKQRVFVGEATTDATTVTSATTYQLRGEYDSGLFTVGVDTVYTKNHNIGVRPEHREVFIRESESYLEGTSGPAYVGGWRGCSGSAASRMQVNILTNSVWIGSPNISGSGTTLVTGSSTPLMRIVAKRGW